MILLLIDKGEYIDRIHFMTLSYFLNPNITIILSLSCVIYCVKIYSFMEFV
jgi:hypothetical protein